MYTAAIGTAAADFTFGILSVTETVVTVTAAAVSAVKKPLIMRGLKFMVNQEFKKNLHQSCTQCRKVAQKTAKLPIKRQSCT